MFQLDVKTYASDALESAMRLAQTKGINSYSWSDQIEFLNYAWMDIYQQLAFVDSGFYSVTEKLTHKLTHMKPFLKHTLRVYCASTQNGFDRKSLRQAGNNDLISPMTYSVSGFDLYCADAVRRNIYVNYLPAQPQVFFTMNNRDPKLYMDELKFPTKLISLEQNYNLWKMYVTPHVSAAGADNSYVYMDLAGTGEVKVKVMFSYRNTTLNIPDVNISLLLKDAAGDDTRGTTPEPEWLICSIICDFPYIFITYKHRITGEYYSGFYRNMPDNNEFVEYNPFAYTGRNSNVEYLQAKWNDKTGMGVIINDWNDMYELTHIDGTVTTEPRIKELGWTPDTLMTYPAPEMYRLLVARLADKFGALNESELMAIQRELTEAEFAFKNFIGKDKSSWSKIDNVQNATPADWL